MKIVNGIKVFTLELNENTLNVISAALMNHPFGAAAPVVNEINTQINAQQRPKVVPETINSASGTYVPVQVGDTSPSPHAPAYQANE